MSASIVVEFDGIFHVTFHQLSEADTINRDPVCFLVLRHICEVDSLLLRLVEMLVDHALTNVPNRGSCFMKFEMTALYFCIVENIVQEIQKIHRGLVERIKTVPLQGC